MRNISANGLTKLRTKLGNEPVCIIEIDWVAGGTQSYADKTIGSIPGKIVELGDLDSAVNLTGHSGSTSLSIALDDTDGSIKALFDSHDPHMVPARVYQYFTGLSMSDRFLLFAGVVTSPISWNEHDRTVKLTILSQLEDREIGFSADEGEFKYLPASMCNKPWPIIFGTVMNNPTLFVQPAITGNTLTPVGILAGQDLLLSLPSVSDVSFDIEIAKSCYNLATYSDLINIFKGYLSKAQAAVSDLSQNPPQNLADYSVTTQTVNNGDGTVSTLYTVPNLVTNAATDISNISNTNAQNADASRATPAQVWTTMAQIISHYQTAANNFQTSLTKYQNDYTNLWAAVVAKLREFTENEAACELRRQKKIEEATANGLGPNPIHILGGEDFPQGKTITLLIDGGLYTGQMNGTEFTVTDRSNDELTQKAYGAYNAKLLDQDVISSNNMEWRWVVQQILNAVYSPFANNVSQSLNDIAHQIVLKALAGTWQNTNVAQKETFFWYFPMNGDKHVVTKIPTSIDGTQWTDYSWQVEEIVTPTMEAVASREPVIQQVWSEPGAEVTLYTGDQKVYIASITPGTVLAVRAFKEVESGVTRLVDVPTDLYSVQTTVYGTITAIEIVLDKPLSHILDQGWRDDIYVTFASTIGPNIADIMEYIVEQYTDLACDPASFTHVEARLAAFPANFPINDKRNVLQVLQEIAFQARCALWIDNGTVYMKYLPEEPAVDDTITESDIDAESGIEVELTSTEELVTKMTVGWHLRYATPAGRLTTLQWQQGGYGPVVGPVSNLSYDPGNIKDNAYSVVLRHNIKKYLIHEASYDYYIFNQPDIVYKMATFWLIRKSNTWKRVRFTTPLHKLNLETFDTVLLNFTHPYVASGPVKAIVESARYDSANNCIHFQCLTPVMAGTSVAYPWFWPADLPQSMTWPPAGEDSGSGGPGSGANGPLPVGDTSTISHTVFVGGTNVVFGQNCDQGDSVPMDTGFQAQTVVDPSAYVFDSTQKADLDLTTDYADPTDEVQWTFQSYWQPENGVIQDSSIDLEKTPIKIGDKVTVLKSVFCGIDDDGQLMIDTDANWSDGDDEAVFDFKFDEDGEKFGAGTAFLQN